MKKLLIIIAVFTLTLTLAGCTKEVIKEVEVEKIVYQDKIVEVEKELPVIPAEVTMADVDMYLGRPDVQYVDLRNFDDKMSAGYISGFEFIPFFDYLEYEGILVRQTGWAFTADDIKIPTALEALFSEDKTIFLMCGSGTRAGYVKAALESLGYDNVINVGGISTYLEGDATNFVTGDDMYTINMDKKGSYTPGTYFGYDLVGGYQTTVVIGPAGGIVDVVFDAAYHGTTKQNLGDAYMLGSGKSWATEADELANYIIAKQGWGEIILDETDIAGLNASNVPHHFIEINHDGAVDAVAGVTIGAEGFVLSWNLAIEQASSTDLGVVAINATPESWAAAHAPEFAFTDGVYYGMDNMGGYMVQIVVEDGFIVDVEFDAIYRDSTKQTLGDAYMLGSGTSWATEADELAAYLVKNQGWGEIILDETDLTGLNGLTVPHHYIEINHDGAVDAVAGVTIGVEGFVLAWNDAIVKASDSNYAVVAVDADAEAWAAAHENAFDYNDGVYFGMDEDHGYYVKVTVEDGFITDVFFDALYDVFVVCEVDGVEDATIAKGDCGDDPLEVAVWSETTKQVLQEAYTLASGFTWASEADELAAAIIDAQEWSADWDIILSTTGGHDYFDAEDAEVIDAVAGVTIGIEGFKVAFDEAMEQAVPTE